MGAPGEDGATERLPRPPLLALLEVAAGRRPGLRLAALDARRVQWAIATGLGPLLADAVRADPEAPRSPHWPALAGAELAARVVTAELLDATAEILEACAAHGHAVTLLKGVAMATQHYPAPHLRLMRDLDLLVAPDAVGAVEAVLDALGYRPASARSAAAYARHHHGVPRYHPRRGVWVEVHRALVPPDDPLAAGVLGLARVAQELRPAAVGGRPATRLSDELALVHLAVHWGRRFRARGGLFAPLDAIVLLRGRRLAWDRVLDWVRDTPAAAPLYLLLSYLERRGLVSLAPEVLRALRASQRGLGPLNLRVAHALVDRYMVDGRRFGRLLAPRGVRRLWQTLLAPRSATGNLLRVPGALLGPGRWRAAGTALTRSG